MRTDPAIRRAARLAALVAVPVALVAGVVSFRVLASGDDRPTAVPGSSPPRVQSTTTVEMPAASLPAGPAAACRALLAKLPERLGDLPRRPVTAGPAQNAAYGDPPITLACGVPAPSAPPAGPVLINGVCWYPHDRGDTRVWILWNRSVPVTVTMYPKYTGEYLLDLAKPVSETIAPTTTVCA